MREITIGRNDGGQRLDKFLNKTLCKMPLGALYKSIRKGRGRVENAVLVLLSDITVAVNVSPSDSAQTGTFLNCVCINFFLALVIAV